MSNPEENANLFSRLTFWYLNDLFQLGWTRPIQPEDLSTVSHQDQSRIVAQQLQDAWEIQVERAESPSSSSSSSSRATASSPDGAYVPLQNMANDDEDDDEDAVSASHPPRHLSGWALPKAINHAFGRAFWLAACWKLLNDLIQFVQPVMIGLLTVFVASAQTSIPNPSNHTLSDYSPSSFSSFSSSSSSSSSSSFPHLSATLREDSDPQPLWMGLLYVLVLLLAPTLQSLAIHQYFHACFRTGMNLKTAVTALVYQKALRLSNAARLSTTTGEITNLMSTDARRLGDTMPYFQTLWSAPLQISIAVGMLYRLLGPAALSGLAAMVVMIPFNLAVAHFQAKAQVQLMAVKDERVRMMNEYLNNMRVIKLFAWEASFREKVEATRLQELRVLWRANLLGVVGDFGWILTPILVSVVTFLTFSLLGHDLTNQIIFPAISIFNIIRFPITMLPNVISSVVSARVSVQRLHAFLLQPNLPSLSDPLSVSSPSPAPPGLPAVELHHASFSWNGEAADDSLILKDVTLAVPQGSLVVVVGSVGAGKSSLLSGLLGEMQRTEGRVAVHGRVAYVPQTSWMKNETIRENILFGREYDADRFDAAVHVSALAPDLGILPGGDQCEIGEKGINLSGGQKQRISVARAVYADADIYLFDDPLASVDPHVGAHIYEECILKQLAAKTRILVTHQLFTLPKADLVVCMANGRISECGTYQQLIENDGAFAQLIREHAIHADSDEEASLQQDEEQGSKGQLHSQQQQQQLQQKSGKEGDSSASGNEIINAEERTTGRVDASVYRAFLVQFGLLVFSAVVFFLAAGQALNIYTNYWLSVWAADTSDGRSSYYLDVFIGLSFATAVTSLLASLAVALGSYNTSRRLHSDTLATVFHATMTFFETTPIGRILNRFSKDQEAIDTSLPPTILWLMDCLATVVAIMLLTVVTTPWYLLALAPMGWIFHRTASYFLATSRELKRLDSITNSPIYAHFSETLNGIATIRAYRMASRFSGENEAKLDANLCAYSPMITANRWLGLRLETIGTLSLLFVALFAVLGREFVDPGLIALTLTFCLTLNGALTWLIRMVTDTETQMNGVERMLHYQTIDQEADLQLPSDPFGGWPASGTIEFVDVRLRYRPDLPYVINGLSATIYAREKIGICGRTGSGKSTLVSTLFRLLELDSGSILIDGLNIASIGLETLRRAVAIIPQDPVLFAGSIRSNLDPFDHTDDHEIWEALEKVGLKQVIEALEGGLSFTVAEEGGNFSLGQRQLFCLARALLRNSKIVVLDEATSAVDVETDRLIQTTIRQHMDSATIITIAHRINTIIDYDRIMVLDAGNIIEFDTPENLMNQASVFSSMVGNASTSSTSTSN